MWPEWVQIYLEVTWLPYLATMVLGREVTGAGGTILVDGYGGLSPILLPMLIAAMGILFSIIGTMVCKDL